MFLTVYIDNENAHLSATSTVNSEFFARVFIFVKFRVNKILTNRRNHSLFDIGKSRPFRQFLMSQICV